MESKLRPILEKLCRDIVRLECKYCKQNNSAEKYVTLDFYKKLRIRDKLYKQAISEMEDK